MINDSDFSKIVSTDDIEDVEDNIKGVVALLSSLVIADSSGSHKYQKQSYEALQKSLEATVSDLEVIKTRIDYMHGKIVGSA